MWWRLLKVVLIVIPAVALTWYISGKTYHELKIPKGELGEPITISISDKELEDKLSQLLEIPLRHFPREICYKNSNRLITNSGEISQDLYRKSGAGKTNVLVDYPGGHSEKLFEVERSQLECRPISILDLIGATTTANYTLAVSIQFGPNTPSSGLIGVVSFDVDTTYSRFYIHLTPLGHILVLLFGLLGIGAFFLLGTSILKFILEEQFPALSMRG